MPLTKHPETRGGIPESLGVGVIDTINLKNLGMYGVGNGMFESRY